VEMGTRSEANDVAHMPTTSHRSRPGSKEPTFLGGVDARREVCVLGREGVHRGQHRGEGDAKREEWGRRFDSSGDEIPIVAFMLRSGGMQWEERSESRTRKEGEGGGSSRQTRAGRNVARWMVRWVI
jgi:hypothetical protein